MFSPQLLPLAFYATNKGPIYAFNPICVKSKLLIAILDGILNNVYNKRKHEQYVFNQS